MFLPQMNFGKFNEIVIGALSADLSEKIREQLVAFCQDSIE